MSIDHLATMWQQAKKREDDARLDRVKIEEQILALHPAREEGSETIKTPGGLTITTTGKITYKANVDQLIQLTASWPDEARPIKTKVEADETALKQIRAARPDLWRIIASAVETKPAKTGITIKAAA